MKIIAGVAKDILTDTTLTDQQREAALNTVHDIIKALKEKAPSDHEISTAHEIYKKLGYVPGAFVQLYDKPGLGIIMDYNTAKGGFYDGKRYPVVVKFPFWTDVYSIWNKYDEVEAYKDAPKKILTDFPDEISLHLRSELDQSTAEKIIAMQNVLDKMSEKDLIDYFNSESFNQEKLPFIKEFVVQKLEYLHRKAAQKVVSETCKKIDAMTLEDLATYFDSALFVEEKKEHEIKEHTYETLRRKFNAMKGETLLEYYDKKPYGEQTKKLMREILETK